MAILGAQMDFEGGPELWKYLFKMAAAAILYFYTKRDNSAAD